MNAADIQTALVALAGPTADAEMLAAMAVVLDERGPEFGCDTPKRMAGLIGQMAHETQALTRFQENLNYTSADRIKAVFGARVKCDPELLVRDPERLANHVYAGRFGNGNEASGDGFKFRGRGGFHLTFRSNYRISASRIGIGIEIDPDLVLLPDGAALTALEYFERNDMAAHADDDDVIALSKIVNLGNPNARGTPHGLQERVSYTDKAVEILTA